MLTNSKTNEQIIFNAAGKMADYQELQTYIYPVVKIDDTETNQLEDTTTQLRKLKELVDDGILNETEFEAKKKQILGI